MIFTLESWGCESLCLALDENNLKVGYLEEAIFGSLTVFQRSAFDEFDIRW